MGAPKIIWETSKEDKTLQDKKSIEALMKRLNEMIQKDPKLAKKAALILEEWLKKKPKP
jgi:hypothetical protein